MANHSLILKTNSLRKYPCENNMKLYRAFQTTINNIVIKILSVLTFFRASLRICYYKSSINGNWQVTLRCTNLCFPTPGTSEEGCTHFLRSFSDTKIMCQVVSFLQISLLTLFMVSLREFVFQRKFSNAL